MTKSTVKSAMTSTGPHRHYPHYAVLSVCVNEPLNCGMGPCSVLRPERVLIPYCSCQLVTVPSPLMRSCAVCAISQPEQSSLLPPGACAPTCKGRETHSPSGCTECELGCSAAPFNVAAVLPPPPSESSVHCTTPLVPIVLSAPHCLCRWEQMQHSSVPTPWQQ